MCLPRARSTTQLPLNADGSVDRIAIERDARARRDAAVGRALVDAARALARFFRSGADAPQAVRAG